MSSSRMGLSPGVPSHSIGARLRVGRERKGLSVLQAAERLHLDPHVVEHLESESFGQLGAPVYVRGYIRRYAELIGEHPTELQNLYRTITPAAEPDLRRAHKAASTDETSRVLMPALYGIGAFVVIAGLWWVASLSGSATPTSVDARRHAAVVASRRAKSAAAHSGSVAAAQASAEPAADPAAASVAQAAASGPPGAAGPVAASAAASASGAASAPLREADAGALADAQASSAAAASSASSSSALVPQDTQLTLRFNSDSWTEVYDASGKQVFADVGSQGSVRTFKIKPPVKISLGNGPGVGVEVNGRRMVIDNAVRGDGSAQFTVMKDGRVVKH